MAIVQLTPDVTRAAVMQSPNVVAVPVDEANAIWAATGAGACHEVVNEDVVAASNEDC